MNGTAYELQAGSVLHAAPGMQMESQVAGQSELESYSVFYRLDKREEENCDHECQAHQGNKRIIEKTKERLRSEK